MEQKERKSVFVTLNSINVNEHTEKKNGLTYLSWAWAWAEVKKNYPSAFYTVYENADGWNYHTDGRTCWVKTGVTIEGLEHVEYLPVMDYKNNSIPTAKVTSFDVNKAIQRSLTKACARHGLGLYIYAGEDLPEDGSVCEKSRQTEAPKKQNNTPKEAPAFAPEPANDGTPTIDEQGWISKVQQAQSLEELKCIYLDAPAWMRKVGTTFYDASLARSSELKAA